MAIEVQNVSKSFGDPPTTVLHQLSLRIEDGEFVALTGRSGSGKSTLLYLLGALDFPTSGKVRIDGHDLTELSEEELHRLRNQNVGFVFQSHYLLPELTALENVLMPTRKTGSLKELTPRGLALLEEFGLKGKESRFPRQLSGGEQQRVAIARALVMNPKYVFADEPTGALDTANGEIVMQIFKRMHEEQGISVILVTHDPQFAARASRQIRLVDGRLAP